MNSADSKNDGGGEDRKPEPCAPSEVSSEDDSKRPSSNSGSGSDEGPSDLTMTDTTVTDSMSSNNSGDDSSYERPNKIQRTDGAEGEAEGAEEAEKMSDTEKQLVEERDRTRGVVKSKPAEQLTQAEILAERRAANRLSAFHSRQRRKKVIDELKESIALLSKQTEDQTKQIAQLREDLKKARDDNARIRIQLEVPPAVAPSQPVPLLVGGGSSQNQQPSQGLSAGGQAPSDNPNLSKDAKSAVLALILQHLQGRGALNEESLRLLSQLLIANQWQQQQQQQQQQNQGLQRDVVHQPPDQNAQSGVPHVVTRTNTPLPLGDRDASVSGPSTGGSSVSVSSHAATTNTSQTQLLDCLRQFLAARNAEK